MSILFHIGLIIVTGLIGSKISNRFKLPGVVGYLLIGLFLGPSFCSLLSLPFLDSIGILNDVALGIVTFIIGSEMRLSTFQKMGNGIIAIILSESFGAFFLVAGGVYLLTHQIHTALIFGAMAPASAPAGTAVVIQEYKARGPLTNALYAVVGLDDGLAIIIYAFAATLAKISLTGESFSLISVIEGPLIEIAGAILLGICIGVFLGRGLKKLHSKNDILAVTLGTIFICIGLSKFFHVSLILSNLSLGMVLVNRFAIASRRASQAIESITAPIYIIFFVIAGAHLQIKMLPAMGLLGLVYIFTRSIGLAGGAFLGAKVTKQNPVIQKYLGFGILSQAGVAIGLAILASRQFSDLGPAGNDLAVLVVNTIAATTIIFEILGPLGTKFAITRAGEINQSE